MFCFSTGNILRRSATRKLASSQETTNLSQKLSLKAKRRLIKHLQRLHEAVKKIINKQKTKQQNICQTEYHNFYHSHWLSGIRLWGWNKKRELWKIHKKMEKIRRWEVDMGSFFLMTSSIGCSLHIMLLISWWHHNDVTQQNTSHQACRSIKHIQFKNILHALHSCSDRALY